MGKRLDTEGYVTAKQMAFETGMTYKRVIDMARNGEFVGALFDATNGRPRWRIPGLYVDQLKALPRPKRGWPKGRKRPLPADAIQKPKGETDNE